MKQFVTAFFILFCTLSAAQAQQVDIVKLYNQAQAATEMGYLDDAIEMYFRILEINPQFAKGYLDLGNLYLKKGQDVNSLIEASYYFEEYLRLSPDAENAQAVKNSLDKLEYMLEKTAQKEETRSFLKGRWASTDGRTDQYARSNFLLDISEFDDKIRIDIHPSSMCYSKDFTHKTVYVDNNADQYVFTFTNDNTYMPSQAGYAFNSQMISIGTSQMGGPLGGALNALGQYANSAAQEKDLQKKTITVYELKVDPIPNENSELVCKGRIFRKELSPKGERVLLDSIFTSGFYKVNNNYINQAPVKHYMFDTFFYDGDTSPSKWNNSTKIYNALYQNANPEVVQLLKKGKSQRMWGGALNIIGSMTCGTGLLGLIIGSVNKDDYAYYNNEEGYREIMSIGKILTFSGAGVLAIGIPLQIAGKKNRQKAIDLYNESVYRNLENREETSYLKIGVSSNGIGLAFTF